MMSTGCTCAHPNATPSHAVVVTGASSGIGRACAVELDRLGFRVFAGVRSDAAAEELRGAVSDRLTPLRLDVTDAAQIAAAVEAVENALGADGGLAGLVNNAGIAVPGPLELIPMEAWRRQFEVNVLGQVAMTQAFLPLLRRGRGRVVNMSSVSGGLSAPYLGAYSASKFALEAITDALRIEVHPFGVGVSAIEPGPIDTPIWTKAGDTAQQLVDGVSGTVAPLYAAELATMQSLVGQSAHEALPVERVVRAVVHSLTARRPRTRYFIGGGTRFYFKWSRTIPDRLRDWIIRKVIGMR